MTIVWAFQVMNFKKLLIDTIRKSPKWDSRLLLARLYFWNIRYSNRKFGDGRLPADLDRIKKTYHSSKKPKRVLIATGTGGHKTAIEMELLLGLSLQARGAEVISLLCDEALPACQLCEPRIFPDAASFTKHGPRSLCNICFRPAKEKYLDIGINARQYSQYLRKEDVDLAKELSITIPIGKIECFKVDSVAVGEHAKAGTLRFFARGTISGDQASNEVYRRYFEAALLTHYAIRNLIEQEDIDIAVFHHGIYVPQGVIGETLRSKNVRVVNWNVAYRRNCFIFSHDDTYHHTLMSESTHHWDDMEWSNEHEQLIDDYLVSRRFGARDWIHFVGDPVLDKQRILERLGCDKDKPMVLCLSNVVWDAQLHYPQNAFENMIEWVLDTIKYFATRPDLQLVIRIHPAEIRGAVPTKQPLESEIREYFKELPDNVFIVPPDSNISSYVLAELCDSAIIYGTKMGVELTAMSIPVIVAGEAWIRNKGLTCDVMTKDEYHGILGKLPFEQRLADEKTTKAKKYAYHFFFRRMIPVECFTIGSEFQPYYFEGSVTDILPGKDPGLDTICQGILEGTPFIYTSLQERRIARL